MDIMYLDGKPILYIVNDTTIFQVCQFLNHISAKKIWELLRQYQINTYHGFLDIVTHDIGTNFDSINFHAKAKIHDIMYYQISVEVHQLIRKIEKYNIPMHYVYNIIKVKT